MMNRVARVVWLVFVWVALWGDVSIANIASGLALALVLLAVFPVRGERRRGFIFRPAATLRLVAYFLWTMVTSNASLARMILSRQDRLRTAVLEVRLQCDSDGLITVIHHLTALTPGITVLEVERDPARMFIHVLRVSEVDAARAEVARLERLVVEACGPIDVVNRLRAMEVHA